MKKILSFLLALVMVIGLLPIMARETNAASSYTLAEHSISGDQIVAEARKWKNAGATYWSGTTPWLESVC